MPEITVLIYTARADYPYVGKAEEWHCFEPFLRTLADQTFKDFEVVIVDALWESRPDWFKDHPQPFAVKHVPASPNYWQERGRPGLSAQLNRGFIWADGSYVWMGAENNLYPPHHLALVAEIARTGQVPVAWYGMANKGLSYIAGPEQPGPCPSVVFDLQGFTQHDLGTMDHRAARFVTDPSLVLSPCHYQHYFGYSSVRIDMALQINGFDELMDGQMALQDVDFGSRLERQGHALVMHRNLYVIEPPTKPLHATEGFGGGIRHQPPFQCNYAIWWYNRLTGRRVNTPLPAGFVEDVRQRACLGACLIKDDCREEKLQGWRMFPFYGQQYASLAVDWHAHAPVRDLNVERERRVRREAPYDRAFIQPK